MKEYKVVTLENNIEYTVVDSLMYSNKEYLLLVNMENKSDYCIRIHTNEKNKDYLEKLDSQGEFEIVFLKFVEKNKDLFK